MKRIRPILLLSTAVVCVSATVGCSTPGRVSAVVPDKAQDSEAQAATSSESGPLTGSYLKQNVQRAGMITDGYNQVVVLDQESIAGSGAADVRELLIRRGVR